MTAPDPPTATAADAPFDPHASAFALDPYAAYRRLRDRPEPTWYAPYEMWLVPWHEEVSRLLRDATLVRSPEGLFSTDELAERQRRDNWHDMPYHSRFVQFSLLDSDGPVHDRLRSLVASHFTPRAVAPVVEQVRPLVERQVEHALEMGRLDFISDFAEAIPGHVIGALIGMPEEDCDQLRVWSRDIVQFFDLDRSDERKRLAESTTKQFYDYLSGLANQRRRSPREDLMTQLVAAFDRGELDEDEFISTCMLIVMAGHGSSIDVLGSGLYALLHFPEQFDRLRRDPNLLPTAVQEIFRFEPPLPFFHRYVSEPEGLELRGRHLERGTRVGLLYGSANRDERVFDRADSFDVARRPNPHKAFGGGAHFCLGIHLARLTVQLVLDAMLQRVLQIGLVEEPTWKRGLAVRGPERLEVEFHAGQRT